MPDRAEEEARDFRGLHFLNIALAAVGRKEGNLNEACGIAEQAFATTLRSRDTALAEARERIRALEEALEPFAKVADEYSDLEDDDLRIWIDSHIEEIKALSVGMCRRARTILSPATDTEGEK